MKKNGSGGAALMRPGWYRPWMYLRGRKLRNVRRLLVPAALVLLAAVFLVALAGKPASAPGVRPEVYPFALQHVVDHTGETVILFTYSVDGVVSCQPFRTMREFERYVGWLATRATVRDTSDKGEP